LDKLAAAFEQFDNYNKTDLNAFNWDGVAIRRNIFIA
jgi:hypothetical protein